MVLAHNISEGQRTRDIQISTDITFDSMLLSNATLTGLRNSGFYKPSPIQLHGIPLGKCGFDLFLEAKSGTGKTAVFTVIALENLDLDKSLQTIMLAPTREIAAQICDVIKQIGSCYVGLNVEVIIGGLPIQEDIEKLRKKVHIIVGSPGRMRYLIQDKHIDVSSVRLFVLDEADKLMDKSFQTDINYIFSALPKQKQVIMSSATYPDTLRSVMQNYVKKAPHICPDSTSVLLGIKQLVTTVMSNVNIVRQTRNKFDELLKILSKQEFKQCLIFCNYQVRVGELTNMLVRAKWPAEQLHGQLDQNDRLAALKTLQDYKCRLLVSTDLAARGIDASNVDLVINFETPLEWQTYLHRIGRAGRFGSYGIAVTILSEGKELIKFKEMMKCINSSLNISYLWNELKFELNDTISSVENLRETNSISETSEENMCSNLSKTNIGPTLEVDSNNSNTIPKPVQCKSIKPDQVCGNNIDEGSNKEVTDIHESITVDIGMFNETQNSNKVLENFKSESFNDLLASFNQYSLNSSGTVEKEDNISLTPHFDSKLNTKTKSNIDQESTTDKPSQSEIMSEFKLSDDGHITSNFQNDADTQFSHNTTKYNKEKHSFHNVTKEHVVTNTDYHKALLDAGLPTSFGSNKCRNKNLRNIAQKFNEDDKPSYKNKCRQISKKPKEIQTKHCTSTSPISFYDDGYNTQSCPLSKSKYILSHNNYTFSRNVELNSLKEYNRLINSNNYKNWYKCLKSHVKQVEMSLYIDELSKM